MNCKTITYPTFERELKRLAKKYRSIKTDYQKLLEELQQAPLSGADLGRGLHKVRMAISAKGKGKSGGARVITLILSYSEEESEIGLLYIYDKSERETITDTELTDLLHRNGIL